MTLMSDRCQPVEVAAKCGDDGPVYVAPGGHDGPTGTNLGAPTFAYRVFMDAKSFRDAVS